MAARLRSRMKRSSVASWASDADWTACQRAIQGPPGAVGVRGRAAQRQPLPGAVRPERRDSGQHGVGVELLEVG